MSYDPWAGSQPPPGYFPPPGHHPPAPPPYGYGHVPPPRTPSHQSAMWAHLIPVLTYLGAFLFFPLAFFLWVGPLVIRNSRAAQYDPYVRRQATEALNCWLSSLLTGFPLVLLAIVVLFFGFLGSDSTAGTSLAFGAIACVAVIIISCVLDLARLVFGIIACSRTGGGTDFTYPRLLAFPLIRS